MTLLARTTCALWGTILIGCTVENPTNTIWPTSVEALAKAKVRTEKLEQADGDGEQSKRFLACAKAHEESIDDSCPKPTREGRNEMDACAMALALRDPFFGFETEPQHGLGAPAEDFGDSDYPDSLPTGLPPLPEQCRPSAPYLTEACDQSLRDALTELRECLEGR